MRYSVSGAARALGVHKATVHRAIKSGRLSAERQEDGTWAIDPAELARAYGLRAHGDGVEAVQRDDPHPSAAPDATAELVAELRATVADLRARLDASESRLDRALGALPAPALVTPPPARAGLLERLLGALRSR